MIFIDVRNLIRKILKESEEDDLEWARDVIATPINDIRVGDVFYIVDTDSNHPKPDNYKPVHARYIFVATGMESGREVDQGYGIKDNTFLTYKLCDPDDATYNSNDYYETSPKCQGFTSDDGEEYASTGINWAKRLVDTKYWRRMR